MLENAYHRMIDLDEVNHSNSESTIEPQVQEDEIPLTQPPRRSQRISRPSIRYGMSSDDVLDVFLLQEKDHLIYKEAMLDIDAEKWLEAMKS